MTVEVPMIGQQLMAQQSTMPMDTVRQWQMQQFFQQTINSLQMRANFGLEELDNIVGRVASAGHDLQRADEIFEGARQQVYQELDQVEARILRREMGLDAASEQAQAGSHAGAEDPVTMQDLQAMRAQMLRDSFSQMRESMEMSRRFMELSAITGQSQRFVYFTTQISSSLRDSIRRLTDGT